MYRKICIIAACFAALSVLQLKANVEPPNISVTIDEYPAAVLLGTDAGFVVTVDDTGAGGSGTYWYNWSIDTHESGNIDDDNTYTYAVPTGDENAKKVTVNVTVTDQEDETLTDSTSVEMFQFKVMVNAIAFNHNTNAHTHDALNIRQSREIPIVPPEYVAGTAAKRAAYLRNTNPQIAARFSVLPTDITSLRIGAKSSGSLGNVQSTVVQFQNGISQGSVVISGSNYTTFATQNPVPNKISKETLSWEWQVTAVNQSTIQTSVVGSTTHVIYTLLNVPVSPWQTEFGNERNPWVSVLDYACVWAGNQTQPGQAVLAITYGGYNNFGREYDGGRTHTPAASCNLTGLLADNWADCRDMSAVVQLFSNAIGIDNLYVRRINGPFNTKQIKPMSEPWKSVNWIFHQVGWYNEAVYDACIKAKQNNPYIPAGININTYKNDIYSSWDWTPLAPHQITIID